ncbi:MAG: 1-phosphofructokinase family hexose kinase [Butyricicoccus pullicaecorum]|nr:1-phosphofructokinase family hexose kinase [Butyricicoccus pullicaecorum]
MIITITLNPALDRTIRIDRPLAPMKLNRAVSTMVEPGGKGINVSRAVKALGGTSVALGFCAGSNGRIMKDALTAADIHHDFVDVPGETRVNVQVIDAFGDHTEINEPGFKISDGDYLRFLERVEHYLQPENIFVITGSVPPQFSLENYIKLCKKIKRAGCRLIIDADGERLLEALKLEPDFVKPNIFELADATGDDASADPEVVIHSARKLLDMGARAVCVSMSQEGALFVSRDEPEALYVNCNPKVFDCGAVGTGDAMVGAIANSMSTGLSFCELAKYTVATGRASARLAGTEMATLKKVFEVYETLQVYTV